MISATGPRQPSKAHSALRRQGRSGGFTLIELLVVLALMALIMGSLNWGRALQGAQDRSGLRDTFWDALRMGREQALREGVEVSLTVITRAGSPTAEALLLSVQGKEWRRFPLRMGAPELRFFPPEERNRVVGMVGGQVLAGAPLRRVRLYPDGTSVPFAVQFKDGPTAAPEWVAIDPFTVSPVLPAAQPPAR